VEEPADPLYLDEELTMRPPPVLLQDFTKFVMHSDVPRRVVETEPERGTQTAPRSSGEPRPDVPGVDVPPAAVGGIEGFEGEGVPGGEMEEPRGERGAADEVVEAAEHKLFRFYDLDMDPTKRYRYRVMLLLEDPNNPRAAQLAPDARTLHPDVVKRLAEQKAADAAKARPARTFWRETKWSEASDIVAFPPLERLLAGGVTGPKNIEDPEGRWKIRQKEAVANMMALVWDAAQAVWVPGKIEELNRGSVANSTMDAWVLDPVSHAFRKLRQYRFATGRTVADVRGGEMLPAENRRSKLTSPGEVLVFTPDGRLEVRSELDDADAYWRYLYGAEAEEPAGRRPGTPRPPRRDERAPHGGEFEDFDFGSS
jgi:hypothetical protein